MMINTTDRWLGLIDRLICEKRLKLHFLLYFQKQMAHFISRCLSLLIWCRWIKIPMFQSLPIMSFFVRIMEISKVVHLVQLLYHLNMKYRVNPTINTSEKITSNKMIFILCLYDWFYYACMTWYNTHNIWKQTFVMRVDEFINN